MDTIKVGRSDVRISRLGLGGSPFGREIDEAASRDLLDYALSRGITLIDTAESYGGGNAREYRRATYGIDDVREVSEEMHSSEKIIGRWLRDTDCRGRVQISTKFSTGGTAANVKQALAASLERLQTDYVDIYLLHQPYPDVPIEETLGALDEELRAGRIRSIGCSNFSADLLHQAQETAEKNGFARIESVQPPLSLAQAGARKDLLPYCREHQVSVVSYSPLGAGFLTGKYSPSRTDIPKGTRFDIIPGHIDVYFSEKNFRIAENLGNLAKETGLSEAHLAMAWVCAQPEVSAVLVGARKHSHLDNALESLAQPLPEALKRRMDFWLD